MMTRGKCNIFKPKAYLVDYTQHEPCDVKEVLKHPHWTKTMEDEYTSLMNNNTWTLVPRPVDKKIIGCKWVFKIKRNFDGLIARYKARLVAKVFHQTPDIDYTKTFNSVVKPVTIRVLPTLALIKGWFIHQLDVNNAYIHGYLHEYIFIEQPSRFHVSAAPPMVCHLKKALYGLKLASRA